MINFFTKSTGEEIEQSNTFENSGIQAIIPDGTRLHANILEATWEEESQYLNQLILIKWYMTEKGQYNGFIVNQKIAVISDKDSKKGATDKVRVSESKADKAKEMLMAIDSNCKGELFKLAQAGKFEIGNNMQLARALAGGSALITAAVYEMESTNINPETGELYPPRVGNWIRAVSSVSKAQKQEDKHIEKQAEQQKNVDDIEDDDLPF